MKPDYHKMVKSLRRMILRRLQNLGVTRSVSRDISERFAYQLTHQGEKGTIRYIKACGDQLQEYVYGSTSLKSDDSPRWVATRDRFPVFFLGLENASKDLLTRVSKLARAIRFGTVHQEQVDKVTQAVVTPYTGSSYGLAHLSSLIEIGGVSLNLGQACADFSRYYSRYPQLLDKFHKVVSTSCKMSKAFDLNNLKPIVSSVGLKEPPFKESLQIIADHPGLRVGPWADVFYPMQPEPVEALMTLLVRPVEQRNPFIGEIHATIEGAGKLRMFASPYTVVACLLYPLHYALADIKSRFMDTDCTQDQEAGAVFAQDALNSGKTVFSVDLQTATCRFPLGPQIEYLRFLGIPQDEISRFEYVCASHWHCGDDTATAFARSSLKWEVGQPLGIPPSMSCFSSVHNLLLRGLCIKRRKDPYLVFRILGDDVIITDPDVAHDYIELMEDIGVPVSWSKSHKSSTYAEFAGFSISRDIRIRAGQWRVASFTNMLEISESIGAPLEGEVSKFFLEIQKLNLFRKGLHNPPPEEWPGLIRLSTEFALTALERWAVLRAPLKYYKAKEVFASQLDLYKFGEEDTKSSIWWIPEYPSLSSELYNYLAKVAVDKDDEISSEGTVSKSHDTLLNLVNLMWYRSHCDPSDLYDSDGEFLCRGWKAPAIQLKTRLVRLMDQSGHDDLDLVQYSAYEVLNTLWWTGYFSELEYHEHTIALLEISRSLLYLPPKESKANELISLGKRIGRFIKDVDKIRRSSEYRPVMSGYYRFS